MTETLLAELGRAAPARQAMLLFALADRGDAAALPAVLQAATSGPAEVRSVAVGMLGRLGDASCVPVLLQAAVADNAEQAEAAVAVLADLPGQEVDKDLAARLRAAEGRLRKVLIQLAGQRTLTAAMPALLQAADDADPRRAAALTALGATVSPRSAGADRPGRESAAGGNAPAAEAALTAACTRMPDRDACAEQLVAAMAPAPGAAKGKLLEILTAVGGPKALAAVGKAAKDAHPEIQDAASRLLGEWLGPDAAPVLLDLAKTATDTKYKTRALRGYIRLARQFAMPDDERAAICRTALQIADREAEKKLVLEVLGRYPSLDTLQLAVETAKDPALKNEATAAALLIAQKIGGGSVEASNCWPRSPRNR